MTRDYRVQKLLSWQPGACDIRLAGDCHCRGKESLLFYQLPAMRPDEHTSHVRGGFYCVTCEFGAAGSMTRERYENLEQLQKSEVEHV